MSKKVVNSRPVVFLAFFFICGIAVSYYVGVPFVPSAVLGAVFGGIFLFLLFRQNKRAFFALYAAVFFAGALLFAAQFPTDFQGIKNNDAVVVEGQVKDRQLGEYNRYTLGGVTVKDSGRTISMDKNVYLYSKEMLDFGDMVRYEDKITLPSAPRNPGAFDERMYDAANGVAFSSFGYEIELTGHEDLWYVFPLRLREAIAGKIDDYYSKDTAPVAKAMFLGIKNEIPEELREEFSTTGIAHVLAISGLHISIIAALFQFLMSKLKVRRNIRFPVNIAALLCYMLITGLAPSVIRAVVMTVIILLLRWKMTKRDTLTALGAALLVYLPFSTPQLFMPGFLMSYGAVFGLLCLTPAIGRLFAKIRFQNKFSSMLSASCAVSLVIFPLTAYYFGGIAAISPLANFYAVPLTTVAVLFTGLFALLGWLPPVAAGIAFVPQMLIELLRYTNQLVAQTGFGYIETPGFPFWVGIPIFAVVFLCSDYVLLKPKWKGIIAAVVAGMLLVTLGAYRARQDQVVLEMQILDVGAGDAIHIRTREGDYLIDNGGNMQRSQLEQYTESNAVIYDMAIVSNEKTNDLQDLIADGRIKTLCVPENYEPKEQDDKIPLNSYDIYDKIELGGGVYVCPVAADGKYVSFAVYTGETCVALLAQNLEEDLPGMETKVLKLAKGGMDGSLSGPLLEAAKPDYVVISARENNNDGQPGMRTMSLLRGRRIETYITAYCGGVCITVLADGGVTVESAK